MKRHISILADVQDYYNLGHSLSDCCSKFGFATVKWSSYHGLVTRSVSIGLSTKWAQKRMPVIMHHTCAYCGAEKCADKYRFHLKCRRQYAASFTDYSKVSATLRSKPRPKRSNTPKPCQILHRREFICLVCLKRCVQIGTLNRLNQYHRRCCSNRCSGIAAARSQKNRSKNEALFCDMLRGYVGVIPQKEVVEGWDCDVFIPDFNVAIMWNGPWHFIKLTRAHSVNKVKTRDSIKLRLFVNAGITPYIVTDLGGFNPKFVRQELAAFLSWLSARVPFYASIAQKVEQPNHNR